MTAVTHMTRKSSVYCARCSGPKPGATNATVSGASTNRTPTVTVMTTTDTVSTVRPNSCVPGPGRA